jgi:hypothetical protein
MKPICRNCHFLAKETREANSGRVHCFSLSQAEREKAKSAPLEMVESHYALNCHMGVWDEGVSGSVQDRATTLNNVPRSSNCFFFPYHPSMLFDAACELQKRKAEIEEMKYSNRLTRIGLWVAAGALALSALVEYIKNV